MSDLGKLSVQIGADKDDFDKKIKEVEFDIKELSKVKLDRLKLGLDTTEINAQIKDAKANLNSLKSTLKDTGNTFSKDLVPKVANGGNALMQFSRIAQDAPYGIIGIGNNITATVEAFSALKNQTGSTSGALSALGSSILGSGGVLLGVSLLTTGLTYMAQNGLSVQDVINKLTGNFDEFGRALKKANEDAVKNSAAEISGMNALVAAASNVTLSMHDRLLAVDELQKQYPAYFGNLSKEQILNGNVKTAVEGVTQALIAKAKAQAYTAELVKLSEEEFKLEEEKNTLLKKQIGLRDDLANKRFGSARVSPAVVQAALTSALASTNAALIQNEINLKNNSDAQKKWTDRINESVAASIKLTETAGKPVKTFDTPQVKPIENLLTPAGLAAPKITGLAEFKASFIGMANTVSEQTARMLLLLDEFNTQANELITNSITSTFSNLGSAIGVALATGGDVLSAIGQTVIQALASFLSSMGDLLIKYGTLAILKGKLDLAIAAGGPVSIAAGIAAVAVGVALKAAGGAIGSFASSGGRSGVSNSSGANANNSSFTSGGFSSGSGTQTVVFEISGQKLIGVLSNTINANRRLGGSLGIG